MLAATLRLGAIVFALSASGALAQPAQTMILRPSVGEGSVAVSCSADGKAEISILSGRRPPSVRAPFLGLGDGSDIMVVYRTDRQEPHRERWTYLGGFAVTKTSRDAKDFLLRIMNRDHLSVALHAMDWVEYDLSGFSQRLAEIVAGCAR